MNEGVVRSSPVQQMAATGSPNWWTINTTMRPPPLNQHHPFLPAPPPSLTAVASWNVVDGQEVPAPESWSQLLLGGMAGEEDKSSDHMSHINQENKLENWEYNFLNQMNSSIGTVDSIKQAENSYSSAYGSQENLELEAAKPNNNNSWSNNNSHQNMVSAASSPKSSCVTSLSNSMLDISHKSSHHECNSTATGGPVAKKARTQPSSGQSTFKVRKEKLGDRITALHQLVSPFGKTDTASVLLEAIGYIRFLQSQVEALSLPYLGNGSRNITQHHHVHGEKNCLFPEDPGQLLNEKCIKKKALYDQQKCEEEPKKDLRSRGLCLVPISCTLHVGNELNGADYWAPAFAANFQ